MKQNEGARRPPLSSLFVPPFFSAGTGFHTQFLLQISCKPVGGQTGVYEIWAWNFDTKSRTSILRVAALPTTEGTRLTRLDTTSGEARPTVMHTIHMRHPEGLSHRVEIGPYGRNILDRFCCCCSDAGCESRCLYGKPISNKPHGLFKVFAEYQGTKGLENWVSYGVVVSKLLLSSSSLRVVLQRLSLHCLSHGLCRSGASIHHTIAPK